jgi:hypothetical protein
MALTASAVGPYYVAPATYSAQPANNATALGATYALQGWAALITPQLPNGKILAMIQTVLTTSVTTAGDGAILQMYYGAITSGVAPPAANAAVPANAIAIGPVVTWENPTTITTAADLMAPVDMSGFVTGLTPGSQYWFDVAVKYVGATGYLLTANSIILCEIG